MLNLIFLQVLKFYTHTHPKYLSMREKADWDIKSKVLVHTGHHAERGAKGPRDC